MTNQKYYSQWYARNRKKRISQMKSYWKKNHEKIKKKQREYAKKHRKQKREYVRWWHVKRKYKISQVEYNNLLKNQNYKCAICNKPISEVKKENSIDHCHKTGKIRGVVHNHCNLLLGYSKENIDLLRKTIQYIRKHK